MRLANVRVEHGFQPELDSVARGVIDRDREVRLRLAGGQFALESNLELHGPGRCRSSGLGLERLDLHGPRVPTIIGYAGPDLSGTRGSLGILQR